MNKDTQFLIDRMDKNHREVLDKIDHISSWKNKIVGASMVVTAFISASVSAVVAFLSGR